MTGIGEFLPDGGPIMHVCSEAVCGQKLLYGT